MIVGVPQGGLSASFQPAQVPVASGTTPGRSWTSQPSRLTRLPGSAMAGPVGPHPLAGQYIVVFAQTADPMVPGHVHEAGLLPLGRNGGQ
jgi:hypothetical protein